MECLSANNFAGFFRLVRLNRARNRATGMGAASTRTLVHRCATQLASPRISDGKDEYPYPGSEQDAAAFLAYENKYRAASATVTSVENIDKAVLADESLKRAVQLLAVAGSAEAKELDNRRIGKPGLYHPGAAIEYLHLLADDLRSRGEHTGASVLSHLAKLPAARDAFAPLTTAAPRNVETLARPRPRKMTRLTAHNDRLVLHELRTRGLSAEERYSVENELAAAEGKTRKQFKEALRRDRIKARK